MSDVSESRLLMLDLGARQAAVAEGGALSGLADGLAADLLPLDTGTLPIPEHKAKLTRAGGRCPVHGIYLDFDPWSPRVHRCPRCDRNYEGAAHDAWWAMGAQLWTVERAVHAAALYVLRGDERHAALSQRILRELSDRYADWPNSDNVLGPSRPFFSTYLESIWLINACHALDLLETTGAPGVDALGSHVRRRLILPSSRLIAGFHEGLSNRQVYNEVAVLSAMTMLEDEQGIAERLGSEEGFFAIMDRGLLSDGSWYEGENYHLFAHRGLWYGVQLLACRAAAGAENAVMPEELDRRYREGFVVPFVGVLPDDTLPSRNDSQYRIALRQWRIAEHLELGHAHGADARIAGLLTRLYDRDARDVAGDALPVDRLSRARSTADAERNGPASALSRADLSWRALLVADTALPPATAWEPGSVFLPSQGLTVLRREGGRAYVALEGGASAGGHGHPHALALSLQTGGSRWLDDPGTGSYVERALHWYRSTLAHAAPLFDGASQRSASAHTVAFEDRGGAGWMSKHVTGIAPGVDATRSIVVCDGYLVDILEWSAAASTELTLPLCGEATLKSITPGNRDTPLPGAAWTPTELRGAGGLEDGFDFLSAVASQGVRSGDTIALEATGGHGTARLWYTAGTDSDGGCELVRADAPAPPGEGETVRHMLRTRGASGRVVGVWCWPNADGEHAVREVALDASLGSTARVTTVDGTTASHARAAHGWHIELNAGTARSSVDLQLLAPQAVASDDGVGNDGELLTADYEVPWLDDGAVSELPGEYMDEAFLVPLGSAHYLQTEVTWQEAGEPTAMLQLLRTDTEFIVDVAVSTGPVVVQQPNANGAFDNELDNERADVNGDGLQWYIGVPDAGAWTDGGLIAAADAPGATMQDGPRTPRSHALVPGGTCAARVSWMPTDDGWAVRLAWPISELPVDSDGCIAFDLAVNERPAERERRRGQLVLSGGAGFAYLRGDRQDPTHAVVLAVT